MFRLPGARAFLPAAVRMDGMFSIVTTMPPKVEATRRVVFVDGIHLGRRAVVLIASDDEHALG